MLQVSQLYIYPIKSLAGIAVSAVNITDRGFEYDRRWMLVDANNRFLSQREFAVMALLQVQITVEGLSVFHKQTPDNPIIIPFEPATEEKGIVKIWDASCEATFVSRDADEWFSKILNTVCRLVYMDEDCHVKVDERYSIKKSLTSFSDGYPILMISEASLEDLNSKATEAIPMNRFRPNLVFKGSLAFEEDNMKEFIINGLTFYGVKPSSRCVVTTIDQATAEKRKEPLKTLATYRSKNNKIYFGENIIAAGTGKIHVGDHINMVSTKQSLF
ncbi:MAG: MOSC domain-containing protein [Chitinophagaceae bacterium]|nr:MOSC domain-containing protein [Chitinophagaceae bacterium]